MRRDEIAFQRQMAIHSAQSVSNRTFGGQLTSSALPAGQTRPDGGASPSLNPSLNPQTQGLTHSMETLSVGSTANLPPQDRALLVRHGAVLERASNLLGSDPTKMNTFRSDISAFRTGGLSATQLIDAFSALFAETSSNALGTLVREVADVFDDKGKADSLRQAWQDVRVVTEDYPTLPGLSGMRGATTSTSGWAAAAAATPATHPATAASKKHTTRVLKLKNSTRRGSGAGLASGTPSPVAASVPGATWMTAPARPKPAASSAFPALPSSASSVPKAAPQPSWIGGPGTVTHQPLRSTPAPSPIRRPAATSNEEAFPALPSAPKPVTSIFGYGTGTVRRNMGPGRETGFSWGGGTASAGNTSGADGEADAEAGGSKGKKKGRQGKKQVLAQWG